MKHLVLITTKDDGTGIQHVEEFKEANIVRLLVTALHDVTIRYKALDEQIAQEDVPNGTILRAEHTMAQATSVPTSPALIDNGNFVYYVEGPDPTVEVPIYIVEDKNGTEQEEG